MLTVVRKLPKHVRLSERLREHAPFYLAVQHFGITYYVAATPKVRQLLGLNAKGEEAPPDRRRTWSRYDKADAVRDIIDALHLQVRDVVLAGIEQNVTQTLLERMDEAMRPTVRIMVQKQAVELLPEHTSPNNGNQTVCFERQTIIHDRPS